MLILCLCVLGALLVVVHIAAWKARDHCTYCMTWTCTVQLGSSFWLCVCVLVALLVVRVAAWKAGDHCMALFDEDGDYYEAVISRVRLRKRQQTAEVVFVG